MQPCPSALAELIHRFRSCFTAPGFRHFSALVLGWLLLRRRHTISRMIQVMRRLGLRCHHASVYRFLSAGRWSLDALGRGVVELLRPWLGAPVLAIVDDTLCEKSGRQLFGTGIHHDSTRSVYSRRGRRLEVFCFGHQWVVLAVHVRCPWNPTRGWAVPVLFRLYRTPKHCPTHAYRKRSQLAAKMIQKLASWLGPDVGVRTTGDAAYCCRIVLQGLPRQGHFVGPLPLDAALYDTVERLAGRGRPRRKGFRIANPKTRLAQHRGWQDVDVVMYGRTVRVQLWSRVCIWYPSAGNRPVRVVVVRDPKRQGSGRAYVSTDPDLTPAQVLTTYAQRWQLEVCFRDLKQELGFEDPRNGWWRRPAGRRDNPCRPAQRRRRGENAVRRTAPLAGFLYALTLCWYLEHGDRRADVARTRHHAPWYRHKDDVSFSDMLRALRRETWLAHFRRSRSSPRIRHISEELWILAGNAA